MMTATAPTQEQVDLIARDLAPDVLRIRFRLDRDWSADSAIHFRIVLSDHASRPARLSDVAGTVRSRLTESLGLAESDRIPYFRFRSQSEQAKLGEAAWE